MRTLKIHTRMWWLLLLPMMTACIGNQKRLDKRVTLRRKDKIPYGTFTAYENLKEVFPQSQVTVNRESPSSFSNTGEGKKAYIIIAPRMIPDEAEWSSIMSFVGEGNQVFISAFQFGDTILKSLNIHPFSYNSYYNDDDSLQLSVYNPVTKDSLSFIYPGMSGDTYATSIDSQYTTILGRDSKGRPDFVKFNYKGGGALYLHFAPMAFTNFFLLHKENRTYYDNVLSYLPVSAKMVLWDEYFRYDRNKNFSVFQYILSNRSLRWAFWLLLLLFGLIYLFESKRRQKMIPVISGLRNNSLDFVKTVGHLYYQRRDNHNLALKMVAHFQDHVRTRYNLPASALNDEFIDRLTYKTGFSRGQVQELITGIHNVQLQPWLSDEELLAFNQKMEEFYKLA